MGHRSTLVQEASERVTNVVSDVLQSILEELGTIAFDDLMTQALTMISSSLLVPNRRRLEMNSSSTACRHCKRVGHRHSRPASAV